MRDVSVLEPSDEVEFDVVTAQVVEQPSAVPEEDRNQVDLRHLEERRIVYCVAVPKNTTMTTGSVSTATSDPAIVEATAMRLKYHDWQRRACGVGSKGFRVYDWGVVDAPLHGHQYVFRRNIADGELAFFHRFNPQGRGLPELVRVIGSRWPIEECFEAAKQQAGLAQYQFRLYHAWYRHITLAMLGLTFLAVLRHDAKKAACSLWTTGDGRQRTTGEPATITTNP